MVKKDVRAAFRKTLFFHNQSTKSNKGEVFGDTDHEVRSCHCCSYWQTIKIWGYQHHYYNQLLLGLSAVLRSRRTGNPASHSKLSTAALRGTCFYPPSLRQLILYWAFTTQSHWHNQVFFCFSNSRVPAVSTLVEYPDRNKSNLITLLPYCYNLQSE